MSNTSENANLQPETTTGVAASVSQSKISGLKAPSKLTRPSGLQKPTNVASSTSSTSIGNQVKSSPTTVNEADFKVGDYCWVNGSKAGTIAFIGDTQFKEGIWAGIILETKDGKNNGSLQGVTYFTTDENRGVFCRLNKLTREEIKTDNPLNTSISSTTSTKPSQPTGSSLRVGAKVVINSTNGPNKIGTLRFIGTTEFAKGEWAGVELEDKIGKNDGSVADKRYFQCKPMYGVFAPAGKLQIYTESKKVSATPVSARNTRLQTLQNSGLASKSGSNLARKSLTKQNSGSQESLNSSIYSATSAARPKVLQSGIMSKIGSQQTASLSPSMVKKPLQNQPVLQSLKEKEQHIAQLLKERDFERAEFTRAAQKFEQTEAKLIEFNKLTEERNAEIIKLNDEIFSLTEKNQLLTSQLDNDTTRIEDLEFQIEEHKLGCVDAPETDLPVVDKKQEEVTKEEEPIVEQLKKQQEDSKTMKEQMEAINIELKQLKLGEEVYTKEKSDLQKQIEDLESQINVANVEAAESLKVKEKLGLLQQENEELKKNEQIIETLNDSRLRLP